MTYVQHTASVLTAQDVLEHAEAAVAGLLTKEVAIS